ncbi:MAG: hypothetical protein C5B50_03060 [Verrucomicrobia bacterium]|nr:MAG: hypothetical protein C5B50_03060 [Verrucomicrobiota bacterium]
MKLNYGTLLSVGLLALGALAAQAAQDVITKTFTVKPDGKLLVNVDRGSLHITTSDSDKVEVKVTRELKNASDAEAKKVFDEYKIEMSSSDNAVNIEAQNAQKLAGFSKTFNRLQVDYTVAIPARFDIDVKTAGGNIEVTDLEGKAAVHTSGGNLKLGAIKGPIKAHTSGGNITLARSDGDADVNTSGGDLRLGEIKGNLVAQTSGGRIMLEKTVGTVKASTGGGDIRVENAYGPITARTSGGNVSAQLNAQPNADCLLKTSGGNVDVVLASNLALDLDARTSGGRVKSDFPGTLNKEKTRLTARLNGGGTGLALETSGGNVNIRRK